MNLRDVVKKKVSLEGDKKSLDEILNKELHFTNWSIRPSKQVKNSDYLILQFEEDGKLFVVMTGSKCLIEDVKEFESLQGKTPFEATIVKINKAYIFK